MRCLRDPIAAERFRAVQGEGENHLKKQDPANGTTIDRLRDELECLTKENIESIERQIFLGVSAGELGKHKERLERIREVSEAFVEALKRIRHSQ
jgi:hypothetical protein